MFEAYSVGIKLKLLDGVSTGLIAMASQFRMLGGHIGATNAQLTAMEARLKGIKMLGLAGGAMLGAGAVGLGMFEAPIKAAREYEIVFNRFKNLNLGAAINTEADHFARGANIMGVSAKQLMQTLTESVGIFGDYATAAKLSPMIASINQANSAVYGGKIAQIDDGASRSLMKFIDRRGGTKDEASFKSGMSLAEKMVTGSGGFIQFRDLDTFSKRAGTAFRALSDQGVINLALLLQEQGGNTAGQSLMSLYQNLVAGRTPAKTMLELQKYGVGVTSWQTHMTAAGKAVKSLVMLHPVDEALLQSDPATWFRTDFLPLLAAKGVTGQSDILKITNDMLSNRNASNMGSILDTQTLQVLRDAKLTSNALGYDDVIAMWKKDPNSKFSDMAARWNDTLVTLGGATLPTVIKGVEGLNASLKAMTGLMNQFPRLTTGVTIATGSLVALAAIGGTLALAKAGFQALGAVLTLGKGVGLGARLLEVAGGLGGLAAVLGKTGLVGAVGAATYFGTRGIANLVTPKDWTLGGWLYDKIHGEYDPNASGFGITRGVISRSSSFARDVAERERVGAFGSPFVAPRPIINVRVYNKVDRDGLTTLVVDGVGRRLGSTSGAQTGGGEFDGLLNLEPVSAFR